MPESAQARVDGLAPRTPAVRRLPAWWAVAVGLAVAGIPFAHFGVGVDAIGGGHRHARTEFALPSATVARPGADVRPPTGAHMDHSPHHGGQVGMVGDFHIEMVELGDEIAIHVSDAERRPLAPPAGALTFDTGTSRPLAARDGSLRASIDDAAREVTVRIALAEDSAERLEMSFLLRRSR